MKKGMSVGRIFLFLALCSQAYELSAKRGYGFIENKRQWPASIDYMADIPGGRMTVRAGVFGYYFFDYKKINALHLNVPTPSSGEKGIGDSDKTAIDARHVRVNFVGSNPLAKPLPSKKLSTYFNYFLGNDPQRWASKVHAFNEIKYKDLYPGIDLVLNMMGDNVKYDFVVDVGADPGCIKMEYTGMLSLSLFEGDLLVDADLCLISEKKPLSYQMIDGKRKYIPAAYRLVGNRVYFVFPEGYDPRYELVIDPLLIFSTYSGFKTDNWGSSATPGEGGTLYSSGVIEEPDYGVSDATPGAYQTTYGGGDFDVGILKYDSLGKKLLYMSYLGGGRIETPHSLLVNQNEELLILGTTSSYDFPTTPNAHDASFGGRGFIRPFFPSPVFTAVGYFYKTDIFVAKLSRDGTKLLASTYLGGSGSDGINLPLSVNYGDGLRGDIIVDDSGSVFVASVTSSRDFGASNSFSTTYKRGETDALVAKLSANLDTLYWAAFLGGSGAEAAYSIKLDSTYDTLFVAGGTSSTDFPTTQGAYKTDYSDNPLVCGWIAKIPSDGTAITAATYIDADRYSQAYFIDVNSKGEVYSYGQKIGDFPITDGTYSISKSGQFLQKYTNNLDTLLYSTTFGSRRGSIDISPTAFSVNSKCGNIYMAGWGGRVSTSDPNRENRRLHNLSGRSSTIGMPVTSNAFQHTTKGSDFYFIVLNEDASKLLYATFLGGDSSAIHVDGGTSRFDKNGIVYHAVCAGCGGFESDFPTTEDAWRRKNNSDNCNNAAFKFDLSTLRARIVTNSPQLDKPNIRMLCFPDNTMAFQNRSVGGESYEWDFGDGNTVTLPNKDDVVHRYSTPGIYTVALKAMDLQTCIGEDIDRVTINIKKPTGYAGPDKDICYGQKTTLTAKEGTSYLWQLLDTEEPLSGSSRFQVSPEDTTSYSVTITDADGCVVSDTVTINVIPGLDIQSSLLTEYDCNARAKIKLVGPVLTNENIIVDFGDGETSANNNKESFHEYNQDGEYRVKMAATREFCSYEKAIDVAISTILVPNVITPKNSSGLNDSFKIMYGKKPAHEAGIKIDLSVYNRWGKMVFQDSQYENDWSAENLEAGVYYYALKIEGEEMCKGWVHVIK